MDEIALALDPHAEQRLLFFQYLFPTPGIVCIARQNITDGKFAEHFFELPDDMEKLQEHIARYVTNHNLWYCPQLLSAPRRTKDSVISCPSAWADLDACPPGFMKLRPSITIESSPGRYQALWKFKEPVEPTVAEDISKRIAYAHADAGADKSGWDLTQLLRIPYTPNHKYKTSPKVKVLAADNLTYTPEDFTEVYEPPPLTGDALYPYPEVVPDAETVMVERRENIHPLCVALIAQPPKEDWSKELWKLELLLFEGGLTREEVFAIARIARCNKYERDNRSDALLWRDVCRAYEFIQESTSTPTIQFQKVHYSDLLTEEQRAMVENSHSIIEDYIAYGTDASDALPQYHQAGIFVILSALLSSHVTLPTSHSVMPLNMWFMILATTTLTRKSTTMEMAANILAEIAPEALLATDGSLEGLFHGLSTRPNTASVFKRDEVSGLLESMAKKDYLAGMAESLASLYDGTSQKRILRRETFEVYKPRLILYTAGIKTKVEEILSSRHVDSGFLPRFVFISGEVDPDRLRPEGPPTEQSEALRDEIINRLRAIQLHYKGDQKIAVNGHVATAAKHWSAVLRPESWEFYNHCVETMRNDAYRSPNQGLLIPIYERLARSGLKAAVLIAAASRLQDHVIVEVEDMLRAFYYVEQWRQYGYAIISNLDRSVFETQVDRAVLMVTKTPGLTRAQLMTILKMKTRDADELILTLAQRGAVKVQGTKGKEKLYPIFDPN